MPDKPRTARMSEATVREEFEKWVASCPRCIGTCDGDLVGEEHDDDCPAKNGGSLLEMDYFDIWNAGRQAAWNAALEAAAAEMGELCDCGFGEKRNPKMYATGEHALNCRSYEAKELIRALKGKEV